MKGTEPVVMKSNHSASYAYVEGKGQCHKLLISLQSPETKCMLGRHLYRGINSNFLAIIC